MFSKYLHSTFLWGRGLQDQVGSYRSYIQVLLLDGGVCRVLHCRGPSGKYIEVLLGKGGVGRVVQVLQVHTFKFYWGRGEECVGRVVQVLQSTYIQVLLGEGGVGRVVQILQVHAFSSLLGVGGGGWIWVGLSKSTYIQFFWDTGYSIRLGLSPPGSISFARIFI